MQPIITLYVLLFTLTLYSVFLPVFCSSDRHATNHRTSSSWPRPFNTTMSSSASATTVTMTTASPIPSPHCLTETVALETLKPNIKRTAAVVPLLLLLLMMTILLLQERGLPRSKLPFPSCSLLGRVTLGSGFLLFNFKCCFSLPDFFFSAVPSQLHRRPCWCNC